MLDVLINELNSLKNLDKIVVLQRYFKTGKGEYGEGDIFLGITVPLLRSVAKKYSQIDFTDLQKLLNSEIHEFRTIALMILLLKYSKSEETDKKNITDFYLKNTKNINNWDLVDLSAPYIMGDYLLEKDKNILYNLAISENLWERRIAVMSTFGFIKKGKFGDTFKICEILLNDKHDLIHKACGRMLREIGKIDQPAEEEFLQKYYQNMPRTMLRYSIEKFDENKKMFYMKKIKKL